MQIQCQQSHWRIVQVDEGNGWTIDLAMQRTPATRQLRLQARDIVAVQTPEATALFSLYVDVIQRLRINFGDDAKATRDYAPAIPGDDASAMQKASAYHL